jgi:hypothetical protein
MMNGEEPRPPRWFVLVVFGAIAVAVVVLGLIAGGFAQ